MAQNIYIDATAVIIGDVQLGEGTSIWPLAVLRGDEGPVIIGEGSNVQDHAIVHVGKIGKNVTVGHAAVINNATIGDNCIIGMNSSILDNAQIGDECIIGANDRSAQIGGRRRAGKDHTLGRSDHPCQGRGQR
jgi:carbonic anhydrase/acetyltransferase-like protein (isoleucine patch superfamily)